MLGTAETLLKWLFNQERTKIFEIKEHKEKENINTKRLLLGVSK